MTDDEVEVTRQKYIDILKPLFLPDDPVGNDIVNYFASLLRIVGMEDKGWDPYLESRAILDDLNAIIQIDNPEKECLVNGMTTWRIGLLMYSHIVEMSAPYEVLANLLRFNLGRGYSPDPFSKFLTRREKKRFKKSGLFPKQKIKIISQLSAESGHSVGEILKEFYNGDLRNAISHSDYILTDEEFRSRNGISGANAFSISLVELNEIITKSKIFMSTFFGLEAAARECWGQLTHVVKPYDPVYKGLIEVLANDENLMCGFKVHWPNNSESVYRRTDDGIVMDNCMIDNKRATIEFFVGMYAREQSEFSPLVEKGSVPVYTKLESTGLIPKWEN